MMTRQQTNLTELLAVTGRGSVKSLKNDSVCFDRTDAYSDMSWGIIVTKAGTDWVSWCNAGDLSWEVHDSREEAAQHQVAGMKILYEDFHAETIEDTGLQCVVAEFRDGDGNLTGWSFSLDSDDGNHGCDERYGACE